MNEKTLAILEKLIAVCKDGEAGFQLASGEVKSSELQSLFVGYSLQRSRLWRDLEAAASTLGRTVPAEDGSAGGKACRTWMMPADTATARDEQAVLSECERGEDAALAAYTIAQEETELPPAIRAMIAAQALDVKAAHSEVHSRRTRFAPAAPGVQPPEPDAALTASSSA
jgi:uncharacterized protein (TIGR02284 family)